MTKQQIISIVTPCFNESQVVPTFLRDLESVLKNESDHLFNVIVIDDSSTDDTSNVLKNFVFEVHHITLHVIRNKFNIGHQKSIYHGLLFTEKIQQDFVIIMDSDGEDNPKAISLLLEKKDYDIVEVRRGRRNESLAFKVLYLFYKILFRIITGKTMNYGNYCMLKNSVVEKIRFTAFVHLPAYLLKQNVKRTYITYDRFPRINGESKMGYKGLLMHAFRSLVEFGNDLLLWLLRIFGLVAILLIGITTNLFYQKFIAHTAITGWFSTLFIGLLNLAMVCLGFFVLGILVINQLNQNNSPGGSFYHVIKSGTISENEVKMAE